MQGLDKCRKSFLWWSELKPPPNYLFQIWINMNTVTVLRPYQEYTTNQNFGSNFLPIFKLEYCQKGRQYFKKIPSPSQRSSKSNMLECKNQVKFCDEIGDILSQIQFSNGLIFYNKNAETSNYISVVSHYMDINIDWLTQLWSNAHEVKCGQVAKSGQEELEKRD